MAGRPSVIEFRKKNYRIWDIANTAGNMNIYTVESLKDGIYYFLEDDYVVIATASGHMKMRLSTAETIAEELSGICKDFRTDKREGRVPLGGKEIQKMLSEDFT